MLIKNTFFKICFLFLSCCSTMNPQNKDLFDAIREGNLENCKKLITPKNINRKNEEGRTPLNVALIVMKDTPTDNREIIEEIVLELISRGANIIGANSKSGIPLLGMAERMISTDKLKKALKKGKQLIEKSRKQDLKQDTINRQEPFMPLEDHYPSLLSPIYGDSSECAKEKINNTNDEQWINCLSILAQSNNNQISVNGGYIFFNNITKNFDELFNDKYIKVEDYPLISPEENDRKKLVMNYKIHLMSQDKKQTFSIVNTLLNKLKNTKETLYNLIGIFKVAKKLNKPYDTEFYFPNIVIYPISGKDNAQKVLNEIYKIFKDIEGNNLTPRFNKKVTSLIYYAQGDGDYKPNRPEDYEDDKIHFKSDFVKKDTHEDYKLTIPGQTTPKPSEQPKSQESSVLKTTVSLLQTLKTKLQNLLHEVHLLQTK